MTESQNTTLIVFGDRTAQEVLEAAQLAYESRYASIEKIYFEEQNFRDQLVPRFSNIRVHFIVGVAGATLKLKISQLAREFGWTLASVVHPSAVVAPSAVVGAGSFVGPLATISSNAQLGEQSIVHIQSTVGHDAVLGDCCAVLPGARISGKVVVGNRVLIGSNAFVAAGVRIGDDCQVDALTYVRNDLEAGHILSVRSKLPVRRVDLR